MEVWRIVRSMGKFMKNRWPFAINANPNITILILVGLVSHFLPNACYFHKIPDASSTLIAQIPPNLSIDHRSLRQNDNIFTFILSLIYSLSNKSIIFVYFIIIISLFYSPLFGFPSPLSWSASPCYRTWILLGQVSLQLLWTYSCLCCLL